jgi:hypothetical protein
MKEEYTQTQFATVLGDQSLPEMFYIITAHNPFGSIASDAENQKMNGILLEKVSSSGWANFPVTGQCEDHAEAGVGIACSRSEALALGRQFQQDAIYEVCDNLVILVDCKEQEKDASIGQWSKLQVATS